MPTITERTERTETLADDDFVVRFEDCTLPNTAFHHRDHVRLAWIYLRRHPPLEALARFAEGLRRFATFNGHPGLYHETITWAFLLLIRERMERDDGGEAGATWEDFAAAHPDLLTWKPSVLDRHYRPETLGSELARRVFVMPDRGLRKDIKDGDDDRENQDEKSPSLGILEVLEVPGRKSETGIDSV